MEESDTGKQSGLLKRIAFYNKSLVALGPDEPINPNWEREIERRVREREIERKDIYIYIYIERERERD